MLFLIAVVLGDLGLQQYAIRLILRFDEYSRFLLFEMRETQVSQNVDVGADAVISCAPASRGRATGPAHGLARGKKRGGERKAYPQYLAGTEAGAAIKPVIISQFVDLDPFATVGRLQVQRHDPAGNGRLVTPGLSRTSVRRYECH